MQNVQSYYIESGSFLSLSNIFKLPILEKIRLLNITFNNYFGNNIGFFIFSFLFILFMFWRFFGYSKTKICLVFILEFFTFFCAKFFSGGIVFCFYFFFLWKLGKSDKNFLYLKYLFALWMLTGVFLLQLFGRIPWRAHFGDGLILAIIILFLFQDFYLKSSNKRRIEIILYLFFSLSLFFCFLNWSYVGYNWKKVEASVLKQKEMGVEDIVVDKKLFHSFYKKDWDEPHSGEKNWWVNRVYAQYFGVKTFDIR